MSEANQCPECFASIVKDPSQCKRCGWTRPPAARAEGGPAKLQIACYIPMCDAPAACSITIKGERFNACRGHYAAAPKIDRPVTSSPTVVSIRREYERSYHFRGGKTGSAMKTMGAMLPARERQPGEE